MKILSGLLILITPLAMAQPGIVKKVIKDPGKCLRCHNNSQFDNPNVRYAFKWGNEVYTGRDCANIRLVHGRFDKHLSRIELDGAPDLQKLIEQKRHADVLFILKVVDRAFELSPGKIPDGEYKELRAFYANSPKNAELIDAYMRLSKPTAHIVNPEFALLSWIADPKMEGKDPDDIRLVAKAIGFDSAKVEELLAAKQNGQFQFLKNQSQMLFDECLNQQSGIFQSGSSATGSPSADGQQ